MKPPRIQVLLDDKEMTSCVRDALQTIGANVDVSVLSAAGGCPTSQPADARLILTSDAHSVTCGKLDKLLAYFDREPCATLVLSDEPFEDRREPTEDASGRAIDFAANLSHDALAGRLAAMCLLRGPLVALRRELSTLRRRDKMLSANVRRLDDQLKLAGAVQRDLLRPAPPVIDGADIHTFLQSAEVVCGDVWDVVRLDDARVALFLADATGHGLPAGMLSVFVKQWLRSQLSAAGVSGRLAPDAVLTRLNREILQAGLRECHFVSAIHSVYDERTRIIRWARGGAPYPILARRGQSPRQIVSEGSLIGVCGQGRFEVVQLQLEPGDRLIFHTDGVDALLLNPSAQLGCSELHRTRWFRKLSDEPIQHHLNELKEKLATMSDDDWRADDVSVLALEVHAPSPGEYVDASSSQAVSVEPALTATVPAR